jgi:hypothetical protein
MLTFDERRRLEVLLTEYANASAENTPSAMAKVIDFVEALTDGLTTRARSMGQFNEQRDTAIERVSPGFKARHG